MAVLALGDEIEAGARAVIDYHPASVNSLTVPEVEQRGAETISAYRAEIASARPGTRRGNHGIGSVAAKTRDKCLRAARLVKFVERLADGNDVELRIGVFGRMCHGGIVRVTVARPRALSE